MYLATQSAGRGLPILAEGETKDGIGQCETTVMGTVCDTSSPVPVAMPVVRIGANRDMRDLSQMCLRFCATRKPPSNFPKYEFVTCS